jgi:hypothetical protein
MIIPKDYIKIWKDQPQLGVTYNMVKAAHSQKEYLDFLKWMTGQTVGMMDNGEAGIYSHDYERWLKEGMKKEQNAETWD